MKLLPFKYKIAGLVLVGVGFVMAILGNVFSFTLQAPVFAVVSSFMQTRFLTLSRTNLMDELAILPLLSGFLLMVFSKERKEESHLDEIRSKSWIRAILANSFFLIFSTLFIYGSAFMAIVVANLVSPFLFYLAIFYRAKAKKPKT